MLGFAIEPRITKGEENEMRKYEEQKEKLIEAVCNCCGRALKVENGYLKEGCVAVNTDFGYFSRRDGISHRFDLCEDCYDEIISQFKVPVEEKEGTELL